MRKAFSFLAVAAIVFSASACKDKLQQIREDGFACSRDKTFMTGKDTPKQHCFTCSDNDSMMKCGTNPVTSGCTEVPCK
jgi:hypothetical protein